MLSVVLNENYQFAPTYPSHFFVPASISDEDLKQIGKFRSRARVPALTWIHPKVRKCVPLTLYCTCSFLWLARLWINTITTRLKHHFLSERCNYLSLCAASGWPVQLGL
jgi:hypothetical protein